MLKNSNYLSRPEVPEEKLLHMLSDPASMMLHFILCTPCKQI